MTVRELRRLLFDLRNQDAVVKVNGLHIDKLETAYDATLVRVICRTEEEDAYRQLLIDEAVATGNTCAVCDLPQELCECGPTFAR